MPDPVAESTDRPGARRSLYRTILIPTDRSEGARRGFEHGLDLARRYGAAVHFLHVVDERTHGVTPALGSAELDLERVEEEVETLMDEFAAEAARLDVEVMTSCCRGTPHREIVRYAERNDVDLIVMGIHGTQRGGRPHVGSTTDWVIRHASVPVLPV